MRNRLLGLSNASAQRRHVSAVRCNRLLAGQTYFNRFIGGAIHLPFGAGIGGSHVHDLLWSAYGQAWSAYGQVTASGSL